MKVFVWEMVDRCSGAYHSAGGVVVFAEDEQAARALANSMPDCAIKPEEQPNEVRECGGTESKVYIMPDAGCC